MNDSASSTPRPTLRLKVAPRKTSVDAKAQPPARPLNKAAGKNGARWSDEYTSRMQAEMNALASR